MKKPKKIELTSEETAKELTSVIKMLWGIQGRAVEAHPELSKKLGVAFGTGSALMFVYQPSTGHISLDCVKQGGKDNIEIVQAYGWPINVSEWMESAANDQKQTPPKGRGSSPAETG